MKYVLAKGDSMLLTVIDLTCFTIATMIVKIMALIPRENEYSHAKGKNKKHILLMANDLLGDTLARLPFYIELRRMYPDEDYHIAIILTPTMAKPLSKLNLFDEIIEDENLNNRHPIFWIFGKQFISKSLRWAWRHRVDIFITCLRVRSPGCDYINMLVTPSKAIGYKVDSSVALFPVTSRYQKSCEKRLYTGLVPFIRGKHQMEDLSEILSLLADRKVYLRQPSKEELFPVLDVSFAECNLGKPYIIIVPGAGMPDREWPIGKFMELVRSLPGNIVIVGTAKEMELGNQIKDVLGSRVVNLCGKTNIEQLGGVISNARLVVSNETGTATYAAILGIPTVCILGGGDFGAFFPNKYSKNTISVYRKCDCYYCGWKCAKRSKCNSPVAPCIGDITVEEVMKAVNQIMEGK